MNRVSRWLLPVFLTVTAAYVVFAQRVLFTGDVCYGFGPDPPGTIWMYDWVKEDVLNGKFPIRTDRMYYPEGIELLLRNGSNVVDAILSVPFQLFFSTPLALVLTTVVIVLGNGLAIQPLLREVAPSSQLIRWSVGAWWMINPYVLDEIARGRPTQAMLWFVPPAILGMWRLGGARDALLLGAAVGLQALTYWYMALFLSICLLPLAIRQLWLHRARGLGLLLVGVVTAVVVVSPLAVPIATAAARNEIPGLDLPVEQSLIYMTYALRAEHMWLLHVNPLVVAALLIGLASFRHHFWALAGIGLGIIFAFGVRIPTGDGSLDFPLYTWIYEHSQFIARLNFPERIYSVVYALLAVVVASFLERSRQAWVGWFVWAFALCWPFGMGGLPLPLRTTSPLPASVIIERTPGPVLVTPTESTDNALIQQVYFKAPLVSGMGDHEPTVRTEAFSRLFSENPFFTAIMLQSQVPSWATLDVNRLAKQVRWVWYDREVQERLVGVPKSNSQLEHLQSYMGTAYYSDEATAIWDIRRPGRTASTTEKKLASEARTRYRRFAAIVAEQSASNWKNY